MTSNTSRNLRALGIALSSSLAMVATTTAEASEPNIKPFGFTQFTGTFGSKTVQKNYNFDRVRFGVKGSIDENISYFLQLELNNPTTTPNSNTSGNLIQDAKISYTFLPELKLSVGQFKAPFSMEYNTAASNLDVINYGMVGNVIPNRGIGLMVSGKNIAGTGLGYDMGMFNAGARGDTVAYTSSKLGKDELFSGRITLDTLNDMVHVEAGQMLETNSANTAAKGNYAAIYAAAHLDFDVASVKAEWMQGKQFSRKTTVYYTQLLLPLSEQIDFVTKWEQTFYKDAPAVKNLKANNAIFGFNAAIYPENPARARMQFNYVIATKDANQLNGSTLAGFKKGYADRQAKLLLQVGF
ncbi:MAG: hypothetical protein HQM07_02780 [Zetaproteobacteria bacterium]|nr:hypothetical protein [Zetaproteobacteria bacterium]